MIERRQLAFLHRSNATKNAATQNFLDQQASPAPTNTLDFSRGVRPGIAHAQFMGCLFKAGIHGNWRDAAS
jgi:hypothetical protein